eukprot:5488481-Amphidinium_carterae.1
MEEEHIGKAIMQEFFTKTLDKQPVHRLWVNNKETRQAPPDLGNAQVQPDDVVDIPDKQEDT